MFIKGEKTKLTGHGFTTSRKELAHVLTLAVAADAAAPKGVEISDDLHFDGTKFDLVWLQDDGALPLEPDSAFKSDSDILNGIQDFHSRRRAAVAAGRAIASLPIDGKLERLNEAIHAAAQGGVEVFAAGENEVAVRSVDPRSVRLVAPNEEPIDVFVEGAVVAGSKVVGTKQLDLFEDPVVDTIFYLYGHEYAEIRAKVPLSMASVSVLSSRISARCKRYKRDDRHLSAEGVPDLTCSRSGIGDQDLSAANLAPA